MQGLSHITPIVSNMLIYICMKAKIVNFVKKYSDIIIISLLGTVLRARVILKDDLWYDEAFTGNLMRVDSAEFWRIISADPHPPLYNLFLKGLTSLIGVNDFTLRLPAFVFGISTIIIVYFLVKDLFNKESAAVAAFFTAISPFLIGYSVEARSYAFYGFLTVLAALLISKKKFWFFPIVIALMMFTHYMAVVYIPILTVFYLYNARKEGFGTLKALALVIPVAAFAVWLYLPVINSPTNNNLNIDWVKKADFTNIQRSITAYSFGVKSKLAGRDELTDTNFILDTIFLGSIVFVGFLLGIAGIIYQQRNNIKNLINFMFIIMSIFLPMIILITYVQLTDNSIYVERYLLPSSIFFTIALSYILNSLLNFEVMGMLVLFYVFTLTRATPAGYYTGMKLLSEDFRETQNEIVFTSPVDFIVGKYYLNNGMVRLYIPNDPQSSYAHWPFIGDANPQDIDTAIFISPDESRMTSEFVRPLENLRYGTYEVWITNNSETGI